MRLVQIKIRVYESDSTSDLPPWQDEFVGECAATVPLLSDYGVITNAVVVQAEANFKTKMRAALNDDGE